MKRQKVGLAPQASRDLQRIVRWIASRGAPESASSYAARIRGHIERLDLGAERGTARGDLRPGMRMLGFERRIMLAVAVFDDRVTVLRIFYGGQDWEGAMRGDDRELQD